MKTGNYKEVYITRDSGVESVEIWNPNIGIAKFKGCVEFYSARAIGVKGILRLNRAVGRLDRVSALAGCNCDMCKRHRKSLPFKPAEGTAWLYNTTTGKRTRVDKDMALIDPDTGKVLD